MAKKKSTKKAVEAEPKKVRTLKLKKGAAVWPVSSDDTARIDHLLQDGFEIIPEAQN